MITDVLMPKSDGTEVILFLEGQANRPKVLAISGGGSHISADDALGIARHKADAVLPKPFDNAELIATVDRLLNRTA